MGKKKKIKFDAGQMCDLESLVESALELAIDHIQMPVDSSDMGGDCFTFDLGSWSREKIAKKLAKKLAKDITLHKRENDDD